MQQKRENKITAKLGLQLLYKSPSKFEFDKLIKVERIPSWIDPIKFGLFTVESKNDHLNDIINDGCFLKGNADKAFPLIFT
ncbi:hypothetical protein HY768_00315 [candidate division TA06 bacterium]|uniref:Uncharacterized protein n=1 Tax=candidate division TA06 bacterium TaxID=2250710 RepID=A0A933I994_UNCT6|nr:hypothetical protein [candidate division TA06 bacterium]